MLTFFSEGSRLRQASGRALCVPCGRGGGVGVGGGTRAGRGNFLSKTPMLRRCANKSHRFHVIVPAGACEQSRSDDRPLRIPHIPGAHPLGVRH